MDTEPLATAGGFDEGNPCPQCGALPLAPGDGVGRICIECGWSWFAGQQGGRFAPEEIRVGRGWQRYARALLATMAGVLDEADDKHRELLLEAANYWLATGLVLGLERPDAAARLLSVVEPRTDEHDELREDADEFIEEALS